jgi:hypothetical protein
MTEYKTTEQQLREILNGIEFLCLRANSLLNDIRLKELREVKE